MKISRVFLYDEPAIPEIQLERLGEFLKEKFAVRIEIRDSIFKNLTDTIAKDLAATRVFKPRRPFEKHNPTIEEIEFEKIYGDDTPKLENIVYYDGFEMQKVITQLIPKDELITENFHIIFTNRLTCTYDNNDYRYHGRALIGSNPSIISTTGIIEAPAKPREYYVDLISNMTQGLNLDSVNKKYSGRYLEYHDKRLSNVIEGYLLQALFYYLTGEAFCETKDCRLNNAHWQKDLLYSQLEFGKLCEKHQEILDKTLEMT